uniref:Liprin-alpha-2-like n=1 Tax=Heterorhabditis bacteriophora TaxID=37862 RepID=A0A1I7WNM5_HETBA
MFINSITHLIPVFIFLTHIYIYICAMSWNNGAMMCDVMPTISEDGVDTSGTIDEHNTHDANIEQVSVLMVNMLEDRDKLQEQLEQYKRSMEEGNQRVRELEKEKESLRRQFDIHTQHLPNELQSMTKELVQIREQLLEKDEEIAERNNTRLLLEHLECLVSRHERSLRVTVMKRQAQSPAGVSSEVEVLKALKSLFEHHKALDEKNSGLKARLAMVAAEAEEAQACVFIMILETNGALSGESAARLVEMQEACERMKMELTNSLKQANELTARNTDLDSQLSNSQKDLHSCQEQLTKMKNQLHEAGAQKNDQEARISTLESRYLAAQREATCIRDLNDKLEHQLANKDAAVRLNEEKQERVQRLERQIQEASAELERAVQREKMNEEHSQRLSSTVDKNWLTQQLENTKKIYDQVSTTERTKERLQRDNDTLRQEIEALRQQLYKARTAQFHSRMHAGIPQSISLIPNGVSAPSPVQTVQQFSNYTNPTPPGYATVGIRRPNKGRISALQVWLFFNIFYWSKRDIKIDHFKDDPSKIQTLNEQEWDRLQQAHVLANVQQAFSSSPSMLEIGGSTTLPRGTITPSQQQQQEILMNSIPQQGQQEAHVLASMLQERLDAINSEISFLQTHQLHVWLKMWKCMGNRYIYWKKLFSIFNTVILIY